MCGFYDEYMENTPFDELPGYESFARFLDPEILRRFVEADKTGVRPTEELSMPEGEQDLPFRFHSLPLSLPIPYVYPEL